MSIFLLGCVCAEENTVEINGISFEIPAQYLGGEKTADSYELDNNFSIRCVDENVPKAIGLWAEENDYAKDLIIGNHPVRHYCQYNEYVGGNHSHAYFASDESVYEISWVGDAIPKDIKKLIKNTPDSKIDNDAFYGALDKSIELYKIEKIDKLNQEAEYNYLEAKYQSKLSQQSNDDTRFKEILITYSNGR